MRRLTLLLSVVCLFLVTAPAAFAQGPQPGDRDGDTTLDEQDACPDEPGPPGSPTFGCPGSKDSDGDGVPDYADACPAVAGGNSTKGLGCPVDTDEDGVTDDKDDCPLVGAGPGEGDGCPSTRFLITGSHHDLSKLAGVPGQAQCYHSRGDACSFRMTLTLDAASAKKLGLKKRTIGSMKLTTSRYDKAHDLRYENFGWGLSPAVKRALKKAKTVTLTMAGTYARGNGEPQPFKAATFKATRNPKKWPALPDTRVLTGNPGGADW